MRILNMEQDKNDEEKTFINKKVLKTIQGGDGAETEADFGQNENADMEVNGEEEVHKLDKKQLFLRDCLGLHRQ